MTVGIEHVDKPIASPCDVVVLLSVLLGVADEQVTIDLLNPKRRKSCWNFRIDKTAVCASRFVIAVEHINRAGTKVRRIEEITVDIGSKRHGLVDSAEP